MLAAAAAAAASYAAAGRGDGPPVGMDAIGPGR